MRRLAAAIGLVLLAVAAAVWGVPYLTRDRDTVAVTPQPDPLLRVATIPLRGGQRACMDRAVLDAHSEQARLRVGTYGHGAVPLELTIRGSGYRDAVAVPADYADSQLLRVGVDPPPRPTEVTICIENRGEHKVALYASDDRTNSRSTVRVDGRAVDPDFGIAFYEREPHSLASQLPANLQRASAFRPLVTPAVLWVLLALTVVGVPLAVLAAYLVALRGREE